MSESTTISQRHIVIEGPVGVGKSSLSRKLVDTLGGQLFLEKPAENPFLARFYRSPERYGFATQMFFLLQRVEQMAELKAQQAQLVDTSPSGFNAGVVADFMIEKDPIFASLTLRDDELALYEKVFANLNIPKTKPDLVVYLQAPADVLKQRIKKRSIKYEQKIENSYLEKLANAYTEYFHRFTEAPLLIVNAAEFNPIDNDKHFTALLRQIDKIHAGKHFFNPLS